LQRIGSVLHVSSSGNMIVKADGQNLPRIGDIAMDENLKAVGVVLDILGPASSPYIAVRPNVEDLGRFVKHMLYSASSRGTRRVERRRK
jgi:rRNA processing protein Gar1